MELPRLTLLNDAYAVGQVLDATCPYDLTYQGWHVPSETPVVLKEFFPRAFVVRADDGTTVFVTDPQLQPLFGYGRAEFLSEGHALQQIAHPNLQADLAQFEANGTAYRVLDYHAGASLGACLDQQGGRLPEQAALALFMPLIDALQELHHRRLLHLHLTPESVFLSRQGRPLLLPSWGPYHRLERQTDAALEHQAPAYAAPELLTSSERVGPWTDVYGLAAALYRVLTGVAPEGAEAVADRLATAQGVSPVVRHALAAALAPDPALRVRDMAALRVALFPAPREPAPEAPAPAALHEVPPAAAPRYARTEAVAVGAAAPPRAASPPTSSPGAAPAASFLVANAPEAPPSRQAGVALPAAAPPAVEAGVRAAAAPVAPPMPEASAAGLGAAAWPAAPRSAGQAARLRLVPAWQVAAALVLALAVLAAIAWLWRASPQVAAEAASFVGLRGQGDSLYALHEYEGARARYAAALALQPDARLEVRLAELDRLLDGAAPWQARGDSLVALAKALPQPDGPAARALYEQALAAYLTALGRRPEDPILLAKVEEVSRLEPPQAPADSAATAARFEAAHQRADRLEGAGDLEGARAALREALRARPGDAPTVRRLAALEAALAIAAETSSFETFVEQAQAHAAQQRYAEAREALRQALALRPADPRAMASLAEVDRRQQAAQATARYEAARRRGDDRLAAADLAGAEAAYEEALRLQPGDAHATARLAEVRRRAQAAAPAPVPTAPAPRSAVPNTYAAVDELPVLVGGLEGLHRRVRYPEAAVRAGIQGRVYVQFVVDESGRVVDPQVVRGIGGGCDEEALRVIAQARFEPGRLDGRPVRVQQTLFVRFRLAP